MARGRGGPDGRGGEALSDAASVLPLPYTETGVAETVGSEWREVVLQGYRWMALGRALDARMQALQRQGRVGFYGAATGQEAVNVAAGLATIPDDWIFPGLREQLVALVRGHALGAYVHHLFGDARDPARGRNMPCHPSAREVHYVSMSSVIGTQIPHAVGTAYALRRARSRGVAVAFFGDGATSANDFHSGLNFAGVLGVPVLFCCTNNQWAISVPVEHQTHAATLAAKASAYGLPGSRVDGTDFIASYAAIQGALERLRHGAGPEMIEFLLYRMTPHSSSDDPGRYQPADWTVRARAHDPFDRLEGWLMARGLLAADGKQSISEASDLAVRAAIREAEESPPPPPSSVTEDVYSPPAPARARGGP